MIHTSPLPQVDLPGHACLLFRAEDLVVTSGANAGDGLAVPEAVCPGDVYGLARGAGALRLVLAQAPARGGQCVAAGSEIGQPGDPVALVARYTMMAPDGHLVEVLLLRHGPGGGAGPGHLYALPLSPLAPRRDYALIKAEMAPASTRLGDLIGVSFGRGTRIALPLGAQRAIEDLRPGDRVLTRDHGAQPIRWIGRATLRATGAFAPVQIAAGAMGNAAPLLVSQHHRMFLYHRDLPRLRTAELLVQARHLVDGTAIRIRPGGFIDYYSLIFDAHEIVYAEGIPTESLMVNEATLQRLPDDLAAEVRALFPGLAHRQHFGTEAEAPELDAIGREALLHPRRRTGR